MLAANDPRHGTANGYANLGCRCDACRAANTAYRKATGTGGYKRDRCPSCGGFKYAVHATCWDCYVAEREAEHGTESRYTRHGCRCDACRQAATAARRRRRNADPKATREYEREYRRQYRARKRVAA